MHLNPDGGITLNGVTLTAEQVSRIKAATPAPKRRTGYWMGSNPGLAQDFNADYKPHYLGTTIQFDKDNHPLDSDGRYLHMPGNRPYVIFWGTY